MSHARETTLTFFVMYLSPLTSEVYLLVNLFEKKKKRKTKKKKKRKTKKKKKTSIMSLGVFLAFFSLGCSGYDVSRSLYTLPLGFFGL